MTYFFLFCFVICFFVQLSDQKEYRASTIGLLVVLSRFVDLYLQR